MHPIMVQLKKDHAHLDRILDLFESLLNRFHDGTEPDYELMGEMLEYMEEYDARVHHPTEELIFERVLASGFERHDIFDVLSRQHGLLGQINRRFRRALDAILNAEVLLREDVEAHGRELIATLRAHIRLEDTEAFPIAIARLSDADWAAVEAAAPKQVDPVFGTPDPLRYRALYARFAAQAQD